MMQVDIPQALTLPAPTLEFVPAAVEDAETESQTETETESSPQRLPRLPRLPRLMAQLYREAAARGHSRQALAAHLGVTVGYLHQLANGTRETRHISGDFSRSCAEYLDIPPVAVMLAAGRLDLRDFRMPQTTQAPGWQFAKGLQRIAADPLVGCLMPEEVWDAPAPVQQMLVALYDARIHDARMHDATHRERSRPAQHTPLLLQALQDAALVLAHADATEAANDRAYGSTEVQP
jgi:transcriptional regulator with XRE-family HTH domain